MPEIGQLEDRLLDEIHGMREDFRKVSNEIATLANEVRHLAENQQETKGHGERIGRLEEAVINLKANEQSAATERRWIIGVLITTALGAIALLAQVWRGHP